MWLPLSFIRVVAVLTFSKEKNIQQNSQQRIQPRRGAHVQAGRTGWLPE